VTSIKDPGYAGLAKAAGNPGSTQETVLDGVPLLEAAIHSGLPVTRVLWNEDEAPDGYMGALVGLLAGADVMSASRHLLHRIGISQVPPKCVFSVTIPVARVDAAGMPAAMADAGDAVVLYGVSDPMNVGVILRHAEAFGYCAVFAGDAAGPRGRQAVRSSTGSALRVRLYEYGGGPEGLIAGLRGAGYAACASSAHGGVELSGAALGARHAIIVGNETHGLGKGLREAADMDVRIAMAPGGAHSLNVGVAASIMMYVGYTNASGR